MLRLAAALGRAFPRVRFFAAAAEQIAYLVEVAADDAAARRAPRLTVAAALLAVTALALAISIIVRCPAAPHSL